MDYYEQRSKGSGSIGTDNDFIKALRKGNVLIACRVCGQCHPKNSTHLYDYEGTVDDDLICHICFQPFVDPVDTKCGCTYCSNCLQGYLKRNKHCPIDNAKIDWKNCHKASQVLRRILDKLLVVCPNVDYCEEALPRHQLEFHLLTRCKGSLTYCTHAHLGCDFQGPRSALPSHLQECQFNDYIDEIHKDPIIPGRLCQIEIHRGYSDLGLFLVGGCDTPLVTTVVQQIKPGSMAEKDGRLQPGDHILKLNGVDLASNTHKEVVELFSQAIPICNMTVYRETLYEMEEFSYEYREEVIKINIEKQKNQNLGIKLGHRKKEKGIWIMDILKGSLAESDGRLRTGDRLLEINCQNVKYSSKDEALKIISASSSVVSFVISRENEPNLSLSDYSYEIPYRCKDVKKPGVWQEFSLNLLKEKNEPLGLVINGGLYGYEGDSTPIFVSAVEHRSCIEKSKHIRKSDLIIKINEKSVIGLSKHSAIDVIDETTQNEIVSITYVRCPENYEDAMYFRPNWRYFISIPITYQIAKSVQVFKDANEYLGLTIAGGKDSNFDRIFIKSVIPNSSAARSKKLRSGDMILSVDNFSLQNVMHVEAVQLLQSLSGMIRFVVISCPGTIV